MYFGSVRFFKHLIVTAVILVILALTVTSLLLLADNRSKSLEIEELLEVIRNHDELVAPAFDESDLTAADNTDKPGSSEEDDIDTDEDDNDYDLPSLPDAVETLNAYSELFPHLYADMSLPDEDGYMNDSGYIYLTFDDGPSEYTGDILRYLNKHDVKATFFVGAFDENNQHRHHMLNEVLDTGHEIGVHTMSHIYNQIYESVESYLADFNDAFNLIYEQTGHKPYLYRFPGGSRNGYNEHIRDDIIEELSRRGFVHYDWNVDSEDALDANWTQMYNSVLRDVAELDRAVVLFHDRRNGYNTVTVIEDIIKALKNDARGYTFSVITPETKPVQFR